MLSSFVVDVVNGLKQTPQRKSVDLRVLVEESQINGVKRLLVEEQFIAVEETSVEQIEVHQLVWEKDIRKSLTIVKLKESKIHTYKRKNDQIIFFPGN